MAAGEPTGSHLKEGVAGGPPPRGLTSQVADLVRNAVEGTVVVDGEGVVLFANPAAETLLGKTPGGAMGVTLGYPSIGDEPTVITLRRPGMDAATVEMRSAETAWDGTTAFVVNLHDITARMRAAEERRLLQARSDHLNQVLRAIASVNQVIIRESDRGRLIRATCDRLVSDGGFRASWLVLTNEDGSVVDAAQSQMTPDRLCAVTEAFARGIVPECCRRAQQERRVVRVGDDGICGACELSGLIPTHSALTACLTHGERVFGYITILLESPVDEEGEEERLLHTIAGDLGFALHGSEESLARASTQRLLEETERVADVGGWEWNLATDEFTVSAEWRRIHGWGNGPIDLSDVIALSHPEDRGRWGASLASLRDGHGPVEIDHRIVTRDSRETKVLRSKSGSVEAGADGRRTVRGIAHDITTTHEATEQVRFQARMLASVGEAVVVTDPEGTILFWNEAAHRLYGWSAEEALGRSIVDVTPAPAMSEAATEIMERLSAGKTWSGEFTVQARDGRHFPALVTDAPVFGENGQLEAIIGVSSDLSERVHVEEALRATSSKLDSAVVAGHVGLWEWDLDTDRTRFSPEWKRQIGYADDELANDLEEWRSRVHPDDLNRTLALIEASLADEQGEYRAEFRFRHKNSAYRSILAQASVIRGEDGHPVRLVGSHVDITELRQAEAKHRDVEAQLQQSQKMESIGRLAGGVAHDFNNVLGVILGISEMSLLDMDSADPLRAEFQEIHQAATRAAALTRQLLAFARKQTITPVVIDLNDTVGGMVKMLSRLVGEDLELVWKPGYQLWPVKVDPAQVDQILANLTVNARDAIQEKGEGEGRISLETARIELDEAFCDHNPGARPGHYVVLSVSDNGVGMEKATIDKAFEPFFTTKLSGKGTGLGLATVYGIVKQNEGFVNAYSEVGEGTTIRVYLPRLVGAEAEGWAEAEVPEMVRGTETLLVVEDDSAVLRVVARILEWLGYALLLAEAPKDALELVQERGETIDLLITDVVMPGMNGRELSEAVFALRPEMKCLFVSGYTQDVIAHEGILEEGMHFLEKPFTAEGLATAVRRALDDPKVR